MRETWQLQEAKAKFSELVEKAVSSGPQFVTKRGQDSVVIISIGEYEKMKRPKESLVSFFKKAPKLNLDLSRDLDTGREINL